MTLPRIREKNRKSVKISRCDHAERHKNTDSDKRPDRKPWKSTNPVAACAPSASSCPYSYQYSSDHSADYADVVGF